MNYTIFRLTDGKPIKKIEADSYSVDASIGAYQFFKNHQAIATVPMFGLGVINSGR